MSEKLKGLYVSPELHKKIKAIAVQNDMSVKELTERLIENEIKKRGEHGRNQDQKGSSERDPGE